MATLSSDDQNDNIIVGFALNPKKLRKSSNSSPNSHWQGGGLADIVYSTSTYENVVFVPWNPEYMNKKQSNSDTQCYDVIIHKLTEDILQNGERSQKLNVLKSYLLEHPRTILIDPIESVQNVLSRLTTFHMLKSILDEQKCLGNSPSFTIPNFVALDRRLDAEVILQLLEDACITLPVICKPIDACGTPNSHHLVVVVSIEGFDLVKYPCLIQQYFNHNSQLYKVYVIDKEVMVYERPSLPNLISVDKDNFKSVSFDSSGNYPSIEDFLKESQRAGISKLKHAATASLSYSENSRYFNETAKLIADEFGLSLFGFDVIVPDSQVKKSNGINRILDSDTLSSELNGSIRESNDSNSIPSQRSPLMVIDVNYFPSYKEVTDFPDKLRRFLKRKVCLRRELNASL